MFYLLDFNPILPDVGLIFWSTITFALFWFIIGRFAFRPIGNALRKREKDIQEALDEARKAREEMAQLKSSNERELAEAREERARILKEAKDMHDRIVNEAKDKAREEAHKIVNNAKLEIDNERKQAFADVKNEIGAIALQVAEQILRKELSNDAQQKEYADKLVKDINLN